MSFTSINFEDWLFNYKRFSELLAYCKEKQKDISSLKDISDISPFGKNHLGSDPVASRLAKIDFYHDMELRLKSILDFINSLLKDPKLDENDNKKFLRLKYFEQIDKDALENIFYYSSEVQEKKTKEILALAKKILHKKKGTGSYPPGCGQPR